MCSLEEQDLQESQQKNWPYFNEEDSDQSEVFDEDDGEDDDEMIIDKLRSKQTLEASESIEDYKLVLASHPSDKKALITGEESGQSGISDDETAAVKRKSSDIAKLRIKEVSQKHVTCEKREDIIPQNKQRLVDKRDNVDAYSSFMNHKEDKDVLFTYDEWGMSSDQIKIRKDDKRGAKSSNVLLSIIHFMMSHVRSAFQRLFSSMLVWWHAILPLNINVDVLKARITNSEKNTKVLQKITLVKPKAVTRGIKNIAFGLLASLYVVVMLSILFVSAFMVSFLVVKSLICEPVNLNKELYFDYTKAFPEASIDFQESRMYSATENILRGVSLPTRRFHATVFLTMPESDFNKKLGIFQVTAELLSVTDQVLITRSQPCMLRFRSTILHYTRSMIMSIPILTGIWSETQTLALSLLEWEEDRRFHSEGVKVLLAPRAGHSSSARGLPEIYKAEIYVKSELPWWFSFMGWKWTFCVWIALVIFVAEVVLILGLFRCLLLPDLVSFYTTCAKAMHGKSQSIK